MVSADSTTPTRLVRAVRFLRPRPLKHLASVSQACAASAVVGDRLQRLTRLGSVPSWSYRLAPDVISWTFDHLPMPQQAVAQRQDWARLVSGVTVALQDVVPPSRLHVDWPVPDRIQPVLRAAAHRRRSAACRYSSRCCGDAGSLA